MDPSSRPIPASAGLRQPADVTVIVADPAWRRSLRRPESVAHRAALAAGGNATVAGHGAVTVAGHGAVTIVLDSDATVKRLNATHRDRNKPTNVLTFDPAAPGMPGEIILALGTIRREANAAGRRLADHLAHLVIHGMLHLRGHDHALAGPARRMEQAESRLLHRLRRPNPWRQAPPPR